jgi:hypothetical protein
MYFIFYLLLVKDSVAAEAWIDREVEERNIPKTKEIRSKITTLKRVAKEGVISL